jgi:hypothetical protein
MRRYRPFAGPQWSHESDHEETFGVRQRILEIRVRSPLASDDWLERANFLSESDRRPAQSFNQVICKLTTNLHEARRQC